MLIIAKGQILQYLLHKVENKDKLENYREITAWVPCELVLKILEKLHDVVRQLLAIPFIVTTCCHVLNSFNFQTLVKVSATGK